MAILHNWYHHHDYHHPTGILMQKILSKKQECQHSNFIMFLVYFNYMTLTLNVKYLGTIVLGLKFTVDNIRK